MEKIANFVLRNRGKVLIFWVVAMAIGFGLTGQTTKRLSNDFSIPSQPGFKAALLAESTFGNGGLGNSAVLLAKGPAGSATVTTAQTAFEAAVGSVKRTSEGHVARLDFDPSLTVTQGATTYVYGLVWLPKPTGQGFTDPGDTALQDYVTAHASQPGGVTVTSTGYDQLQNSKVSGKGPGLFVEVLLGGVGALLVLAFVFASFMALTPLMVAIVAIPVTFAVMLPLTYITHNVNVIAQFLVGLIGLGVAIDYSLLLVTRWREERDKGRDNDSAVRIAVEQAGHSVVFSGCAVAIGLLSLTVLPVPWLRALGVAGMLIPLVSTLVTITFTPAFLARFGPWLDRPRIRHEKEASRAWTWWSKGVVKRPALAAGVAVVILGVLCIPFFSIKVGLSGLDSLASSGKAYDGLQELRTAGFPTGSLTPVEVLVRGDAAPVVAAAKKVSGVATAYSPAGVSAGGLSVVDVVPVKETVNTSTTGIVKDIRSAVDGLPGVAGSTGIGAIQLDYEHAVYGNFPTLIAVLLILTFLALARAFRSVLLALKAVLLNLLSLGATFGAMTLVWQEGHGSKSLFGIESTGSITFWVPIMVFAFLYGLSMDYEVFILTRMREAYDEGGRTGAAVIEGLGRTGRLVTSAALILFLAFVSLASSPGTDIKVMATGLGAGILLDATVVRALLVPALVTLFGRWNWWIPAAVARPLFVEPHEAIVEPDDEPELVPA